MFDPVIFENLKIAMENQLYDLDNIDGRITIIDRTDYLDLAVMSRSWSLTFTFPHLISNVSIDSSSSGFSSAIASRSVPLRAVIMLSSSIQDLADEILEREGSSPACSLQLKFICPVQQPAITCPQIEELISSIWQRDLRLKQKLSASFGSETISADDEQLWLPSIYENVIELSFDRRINEDQMEDIEQLLEHTLVTLEALEDLL